MKGSPSGGSHLDLGYMADIHLSSCRRKGRALAVEFHWVRLLRWAWNRWSEVRLWHGHHPRVAFVQVELCIIMTQSGQMGSLAVPWKPPVSELEEKGRQQVRLSVHFCEMISSGLLVLLGARLILCEFPESKIPYLTLYRDPVGYIKCLR